MANRSANALLVTACAVFVLSFVAPALAVGCGKVVMQDFHFVKKVDKASAKLL